MSDTKLKKNCQAPCVECDIEPFTRNYYFTGKLLVERDFRQEQDYYVDKFHHHDQTLHGWGVVCGLKVKEHQNLPCRSRFICIEPGTAIDCCGHEILVHDEECIDITQLDSIKALIAKKNTDPDTHTLQVCVRYRECPTEQIPVLYDDCGCNETQCAPNRILESYDIDVIVDPTDKPQSPRTPSFDWENTINVAHSQNVAVNAATSRLYVLTSDNPAAIYKVSTDNFAIMASHTLTATEGAAQALAVSNDGTQLYVALSNENLLVLNTADFSEAATTTIPGGAGIKVDLAVAPAPDNRLLSLVEATGNVLVWPSSITNGVAPVTINLTTPSPSIGITASTDAKLTYSVSGQNVEVDTLANGSNAATNLLPADAVPTAIALVSSSSGDQLVVSDQKNRLFLVAMTSPPTLVGTAPLSNPGVSVAASPDGLWAYVLEQDASGDSFVEAIDLGDLRQNLPLVLGTRLPVGLSSRQVVLSQSGETLYIPYLGDTTVATDGGVAIVTVSEKACCDLFWKSLDGCPSCETANCVVLATIEKYKVGFSIQDQTDPAADPAEDMAKQIARIDDRTRHLLPSTSTIAEVVKCLCESKGAKGLKGDPGPAGKNGLGLNPDLPKIIDIGWSHGKAVSLDLISANLSGYNTSDPSSLLQQIQAQIANDNIPILTVYFNQPVLQGIDRQTFRISIEYPDFTPKPQFTGLYNLNRVELYGYPILVPGPLTTPHTNEQAQSAYCFIPDQNFFTVGTHVLGNVVFQGLSQQPPLDPPCMHVCLKGDFIYAGAAFVESMMLDADNVGGLVGNNVVPRGNAFVHGGVSPSGDMVEGGDFESWFFLKPPPNQGLPVGALTNLNSASAAELATVPGITAALAKKIAAERDANGPFSNLADLTTRLKLTDRIVNAFRDHVTFN